MSVITYIATRSLESGTTFNDQRQIENQFHSMPRTSIPKTEQREALDGTRESYLHAIIRRYDVVSDYIGPSEIDQWREFLDSVANSEVFELDRFGTIATPGDSIDVMLVSESLREEEAVGLIRQIRFTVQEVP
jgi:hypothetical protein